MRIRRGHKSETELITRQAGSRVCRREVFNLWLIHNLISNQKKTLAVKINPSVSCRYTIKTFLRRSRDIKTGSDEKSDNCSTQMSTLIVPLNKDENLCSRLYRTVCTQKRS